jgi:hypothetical protein
VIVDGLRDQAFDMHCPGIAPAATPPLHNSPLVIEADDALLFHDNKLLNMYFEVLLESKASTAQL